MQYYPITSQLLHLYFLISLYVIFFYQHHLHGIIRLLKTSIGFLQCFICSPTTDGILTSESLQQMMVMESSSPGGPGPYGYPQYGYGNAANTWYACTMVDANGKEIPWIDRDGNILKTVAERYRPAPGRTRRRWVRTAHRVALSRLPDAVPLQS